MSSSFIKVGDEITLNYGKALVAGDRVEGEYPVVGSSGVVGSHNEFVTSGPGIVVGRKGSVGILTWLEKDFWSIDTTYYVSLNSEGDLKYWYYQLKNLKLETLNSHAAVPGLNRDNVYRIDVIKRNSLEQKKIAKILGDLDRKIELNRKTNETFEQIGQALFKKNFIDSPERESWGKKPLDEIAEFLNGLASQKYPLKQGGQSLPVIKIRELSSGVTDSTDRVSISFPQDYIIDNGDFLFAWSGTLMTKIWTGGRGALNQHIFKVTSKDYPKWFYYHWVNHYLEEFVAIAKAKAVTMGHIKRSHLSGVEVSIPSNGYIEEYNALFSSLLNRQVELLVENNTLSSLRDSLLPKLISGEIQI